MNLHKFSQSLEQIIYDVLMWVIFYPYTLVRVLFSPIAMTQYVATQLERDEGEDRFNGLSPPFFLFLCVLFAWLLAHPPTLNLATDAAGSLAAKALNSSQNLIMFKMILLCIYPLLGALVYEWLTPGGISHGSFRRPFYQQAYICAPYALISGVASSYMNLSTVPLVKTAATAVVVAIVAWFIITQARYFKAQLGRTWLISGMLAAGVSVLGWTLGFTIAALMISI